MKSVFAYAFFLHTVWGYGNVSVEAESCFLSDQQLVSLDPNVSTSQHVAGYAPTLSWQTLFPNLSNSSFQTEINKLKAKLGASVVVQLPVLEEDFSDAPLNALQCQLACIFHPKCLSFTYMLRNGSRHGQYYGEGCYLRRVGLRGLELQPPNVGAIAIVGPRLCPEFAFEDWDNDGTFNDQDGCPLVHVQTDQSCPCLINSEYPPDAMCGWEPRASDECLIPLKDFRGKRFEGSPIGGGINESHRFHEITSPERCLDACRDALTCDFFTFSRLHGCFLQTGRLPSPLGHLGLPNEPVWGFVSGTAECKGSASSAVAPRCLRKNVRLEGRDIWSTLPLISRELCAQLCGWTRACVAWIFDYDSHNSGRCQLLNRLEREITKNGTVSAPRDQCGSCQLDSDGDEVFDCRVFPGVCGCGRLESPPLCTQSSRRRLGKKHRLEEDTVQDSTSCIRVGQSYVEDDNAVVVLPRFNPLTGWLLPNGTDAVGNNRLPKVPEECQLMCQYATKCTRWNFDIEQTFGCFLFASKDSEAAAPTAPASSTIVCGPKFCAGSCFDGIKNQDEEMIDCGGQICAPCGTLCHDGRLNQNEDDIDCGGVCEQCSCLRRNGGCSHFCIPFDGKPACFCRPGFELGADGRTCVNINQCTEGIPIPCRPYSCRTLQGSFECVCPQGWTPSPPQGGFCTPPVQGACWANNTLIEASVYNKLFSPVKPTSGIVVPTTAEECRIACYTQDQCFTWIFVEDSIASEAFIAKGCHLRGVASGAQSNMKFVTSGYKFGNPADASCQYRDYPISALPVLASLDAVQIDPFDMATVNTESVDGLSFLLSFQLPEEAFELTPEYVQIKLMSSNPSMTLDESSSVFYVATSMTHQYVHRKPKRTRQLLSLSREKAVLGRRRRPITWQPLPRELSDDGVAAVSQAVLDPIMSRGLLEEPLEKCSVSSRDGGVSQCLLRASKGIPDSLIELAGRLCFKKNATTCGTEFRTSQLRVQPLQEDLLRVRFNAREQDGSRIGFDVSWETPASEREAARLKQLQRAIHDFQIVAFTTPLGKLREVLKSTSVRLAQKTSMFSIRAQGDDAINDSWSFLDAHRMTDDDWSTSVSLSVPPPCPDAKHGIVELRVALEEPLCVETLQLFWRERLAPQSIRLRQYGTQNTFDFGLTPYACHNDRADRFSLNATERVTSRAFESSLRLCISRQTKTLHMTLMQPCAAKGFTSTTTTTTTGLCPSSYTLREVILRTCDDVVHTWLLDLQAPEQPFTEKARRILFSKAQQQWSFSAPQPGAAETTALDLDIRIQPSHLHQFVVIGNDNRPIRFPLHRGSSLNGRLSVAFIYALIASSIVLFATSVAIYCWYQWSKKRRAERGSQSRGAHKALLNVFDTSDTKHGEEQQHQSESNPTQPGGVPAGIISPGGTLYSILDMFSRMLSSIPEEEASDAGELSRRLSRSASSGHTWRFWNNDGKQRPLTPGASGYQLSSPEPALPPLKSTTSLSKQATIPATAAAVSHVGAPAAYASHMAPALISPHLAQQQIVSPPLYPWRSEPHNRTNLPASPSPMPSTVTGTSPRKRRTALGMPSPPKASL